MLARMWRAMMMKVHNAGATRDCVTGAPRIILRFEALLVLLGLAYLYWRTGSSWWLFAAFLLAPDALMVGYLWNTRIGALLYNAAHTFVGPCVVAAFAVRYPAFGVVAIIWASHIAFDRACGYGLKYDDSFAHTHLGVIGKNGPGKHPEN